MTQKREQAADAEKQVAATLAAALIARGFTLPAATNTTMAAAQAVELYGSVLDQLRERRSGATP